MNLRLLIHTLRHLRLRQVCYQVRYRLQKPRFVAHRVTTDVVRCNVTKGVDRYLCCEGEKLNFLNITDDFRGWTDTSKGKLWAYKLNYRPEHCRSQGSDNNNKRKRTGSKSRCHFSYFN